MRSLGWCLMLGLLTACSTRVDGRSDTGGNTSWLSECQSDRECPDGICAQGGCTRGCDDDAACATLDPKAACRAPSAASAECGGNQIRSACLPRCATVNECQAFGTTLECVNGFCQATQGCHAPASAQGGAEPTAPATAGTGNVTTGIAGANAGGSDTSGAADGGGVAGGGVRSGGGAGPDVEPSGGTSANGSAGTGAAPLEGSGGADAGDGGAPVVASGGANATGGALNGAGFGGNEPATGGAQTAGAAGAIGQLRIPECPGTFERCDSERCRQGAPCASCPDGQVCVEVELSCGPAGGSTAQCMDDPCVGQALDCSCAGVVCESVDTTVPLTCSVYSQASFLVGPSRAPFLSCIGGGVCASPDTLIATPRGAVPIEALRAGDLVYSMSGNETAVVPLVQVRRTPVHDHTVLRVTLADGSHFEISGPHPTADGRTLDSLLPGDDLDGRTVVSIERIAYEHSFTYDILPATPSGSYVANGVWMGSTLR